MKHTKEPWKVSAWSDHNIVAVDAGEFGGVNCVCTTHHGVEDAQRIVDCVNALAGVDNPVELIKNLRRLIKDNQHQMWLNDPEWKTIQQLINSNP